ncbi:MAG: RDD family protein [Gammaproteobacteria bacterium]|nr:RDD family protein [Gammaproteobacteria bacterium]
MSASGAGLGRRLAAIAYDLLILAAILMLATALWMPFTREPIAPGNFWYRAYLLALTVVYFCGFWIHGGQTPGMRAWRLRVERSDDQRPLRWQDALLRALAAAFSWGALGLGFLSALTDREQRTWHDRLSGTRLVGC